MDASTAVLAAEASIGYGFGNRALIRRALTHRSLGGDDYELLEFLGDAVLELLARELLLEEHPLEDEGRLTRRKRSLVSSRALASAGRRLGLDGAVMAGGGMPRPSGSVISDVVESVCGAVYLDAGLDTARAVIRKAILVPLLEGGSDPGADPRSGLQEMCQARGMEPPVYRVVRSGGPDHDPVFEARVSLAGREAGSGSGATKRQAQSAAARDALGRFRGGQDGLLSVGGHQGDTGALLGDSGEAHKTRQGGARQGEPLPPRDNEGAG